jgi:hypothetical protein
LIITILQNESSHFSNDFCHVKKLTSHSLEADWTAMIDRAAHAIFERTTSPETVQSTATTILKSPGGQIPTKYTIEFLSDSPNDDHTATMAAKTISHR